MTDDSEHMTAPDERFTPALRDDLAKGLAFASRSLAQPLLGSSRPGVGRNVGPKKERLVK
jgi:hypothetical protein